MWSDYVSNGKDSWGVNDPEGREEIFSFIEENNISGVLLISGDRHGARGFTIPRNSGFGFYEFEAASLGARVGPPATDPRWNTQLYGIDGKFAFGEFTYLPSDDDPAVIFRLVGEAGNYLYEHTLRKSELTPE
jgi:alkaline phosphatase D